MPKTPPRPTKAAPRPRTAKPITRAAAKAPARATRKATPLPAPPAAEIPGTKQSRLIALLRSASGATLPQMTELTGWQPHTVRGTISGVLRKKLGLSVSWEASDAGVRVYRIVEA